jgi:hypothetical protein
MSKSDGVFLAGEGTLFHALEGFEIDGDAEGSAHFILAAVSTTDCARLIIKNSKVFAKVLG